MSDPSRYCVALIDTCLTMAEWASCWQAASVIAMVIFGSVGLYKIYQELRRLDEQRLKDIQDKEVTARLKRTEFFLAQHRRLFDDKDLYEILCLIDSDDPRLADERMWDKKRKLMAFFEEIALLVRSKQIDDNVAFYMFGYYSYCAMYGENFKHGINVCEEYWGLFFEFATNAKVHNDSMSGPPPSMSL
ncbi:hypothetical protein [Pseudomonas sp. GL-RE-26]|uniref:hypothetical protein n=1 Tax=Pseudomonas sp. GL-RE-26 TaxID=2832390 RepID=UPI001CC00FAA|nr:hypothetical protein [Pseudomonas sp. GL-RE-26]